MFVAVGTDGVLHDAKNKIMSVKKKVFLMLFMGVCFSWGLPPNDIHIEDIRTYGIWLFCCYMQNYLV